MTRTVDPLASDPGEAAERVARVGERAVVVAALEVVALGRRQPGDVVRRVVDRKRYERSIGPGRRR
jgi:hypothetical protein